jgi:hypothetical protein
MEKMKNMKSSKFFKKFELNRNKQSIMSGGAGTNPGGSGGSSQGTGHITFFTIIGSEGCSVHCPDSIQD